MTKTRNLSDLLDANGDVKLGNLDNVPASNDASALTTGTLPIARIADGDIALAKLSATGTKDATTFLRGDNTFAEAGGGGKLLQVIQATDSTTRSTTSTSYVHASSTLSVDITPATTSSKIFISASFSARKDSGMTAFTVFRDGSAITGAGNLAEPRFNSGDWQSMNGFNWLDSPSTTSSVNYRLYMKSSEGSNTSYLNYNGVTGTITVMEIGA